MGIWELRPHLHWLFSKQEFLFAVIKRLFDKQKRILIWERARNDSKGCDFFRSINIWYYDSEADIFSSLLEDVDNLLL